MQEELKKWEQVEREFFTSLSHLAQLYTFQPLNVKDKVFPDNVRCAYHDAVLQLNAIRPEIDLIVLQDEEHAACLATIKTLDTGSTLYYIPVRPLWELVQDNKQRQLANLLLSVYAYLYQVVAIPYYRETDSYLHGTYEMMEEWVKDDPESFDIDDYMARVNNFNALQWFGDKIRDSIRHPYHLHQFRNRVSRFKPANETEAKLHEVSRRLFKLYTDYQGCGISDNIHYGWVNPQEEERIYHEQYISFYWDYNDCLYPSLFETVNAELQERSVTEEPLAVQLFDEPQVQPSNHELDFEKQLFELLIDLTSLL